MGKSADVRADRGAAAVEFALVLPILLLLVFGIVDYGRAYNAKVTLTHAAREGARMLAVENASTSDISTALTSSGRDIATGITATVDTAQTNSCTAGAKDAKLVLKSSFSYVTPLPGIGALFGGGWNGGPVTFTAKAVMRCGG